MLKTFFLSCLLLINFALSAQQTAFDEYFERYNAYNEHQDPLAVDYLDSAILYGVSTKRYHDLGDLYFDRLNYRYMNGSYLAALDDAYEAKKYYSQTNDSCSLQKTMINIANVMSVLGDKQSALQFLTGIRHCQCPDGSLMTLIHYNTGLLFSEIERYDDARERFEMAIESAEKAPSSELDKLLAQMSIHAIDFEEGKRSEAIRGYQAIINRSDIDEYIRDIGPYLYTELSFFLTEQEQFDSAEYYLNECMAIDSVYFPQEQELLYHLYMGKLRYAQENYKQAHEAASKGYTLAKEISDFTRMMSAQEMLIPIEEALGNYSTSIAIAQEHIALRDSLDKAFAFNSFAIQNLKRKSEESDQLKTEVARSRSMLQKQNQIKVVLIIIIILAGLLIYVLSNGNRKRNALNQKLTLAGAYKDQMITTLTHEVRAPLNEIEQQIEQLRSSEADLNAYREMSDEAASTLDILRQKIDTVLQWSLEQIRGSKVNKRSVQISEIVNTSVQTHASDALEKELLIDTISVDEHCNAWCDPTHLQIIMENIIDNAIAYSEQGGSIRIRCSVEHTEIHISIQDHGSGMTDEQLDNIERNMIYVDGKSSTDIGIGLSLVSEYLKLNRGRMQIASTSGEGTTVSIYLPKYIG